jgi:hypothetical protein
VWGICHFQIQVRPCVWAGWLQACVAGMFEYKDFGAFKQHLRDFLVQVPSHRHICVNTCIIKP